MRLSIPKTMEGFLIIYVTTQAFYGSMPVHSLKLNHESEESKDDLLQHRSKILTRRNQQIARFQGDLTLGAMIPIHRSASAGICSEPYFDGILLAEAIMFALREVKKRKLLPPRVTLGYEIRDTCNSMIVAQRHTLDIVNEATKYVRNSDYTNDSSASILMYSSGNYKQSNDSVIAVVGAGNSEISVAVNRVLSAFNIPQIGFASTTRFLSEKQRFPSFFRTVPPDTYQVQGLVALFQKFSWNYIGLLVSDGDYGRPLAESFKSLAKVKGICITHEQLVPFQVNKADATSIVKELNSSVNVDIVVILLPERDVGTLLLAMLDVGLRNKTLIASDSWSKSIKDLKFSNVVAGTLGFAHRYTQVKEFEDHFLSLKPNKNAWNPWFNETWEHLFGCVLPERDPIYPIYLRGANRTHTSRNAKRFCDTRKQHLKKEQFTRFHYVTNAINAVFAIATGIQRWCDKNRAASSKSSCDISSLSSLELLETLKQMTFKKYNGENITFDENGDVSGKYNVVNIRPDLLSKKVGLWNGEYLKIDDSEIWWNTDQRCPPKGVCSVLCSAGSYQIASGKDPKCCWTCQLCHSGTISNRSGAAECIPCPKNYMTNANKTACIFIPLSYLDWRSFWTVSIVIMTLISVLLLLFVAILFVRYVNTPVVKSSNRELSLLLGVGLFLTFLVPFVFAGKPTNLKCIISQMMFCVGCALALSAMLFRTLRIVLLFEFRNRRRWILKNKYQIAMTIALSFAELTYCLLWVAVNPPGVKTVMIQPSKRYLVCKFDTYWYGGSHFLLIVLSVACTVLAVRGRRLPKNFNEVRYIGLSMFTFNIVWVVFMGAQYGASLQYDVKINCFAMIISSLMILVLLFGPKVFVLLFRAHLNNKEEFEAEVRRYSFGLQNGNVSTYSVSVTSSRRGSSVTFQTASHSNYDQFLSVGSNNDIKRMRSHSFDAMASRLAQRVPRRYSKETQTDFPGDHELVNVSQLRKNAELSPIIVEITEVERDEKDSVPNEERYFYGADQAERPNLKTGDFQCNGNADVEIDNKGHLERTSSLQKLNKLLDLNLESNKASKSRHEYPQELNALLDDLGVISKNTPDGDTSSIVPSTEKHPSNRELAIPSKGANRKSKCQADYCERRNESRQRNGQTSCRFPSSCEDSAHARQMQKDMIKNDVDSKYDLKKSDRRRRDRETIL